MQESCQKCGSRLESAWKFCPGCGQTTIHGTETEAADAKPEKAPLEGTFSGLMFGLIATPILLIVGGLCCISGVFTFLGIPMIVLGLLAPLMGPLIGFSALKGKCPWCGAKVSSMDNVQSFDCEACKHRIMVKNHKFVPAA